MTATTYMKQIRRAADVWTKLYGHMQSAHQALGHIIAAKTKLEIELASDPNPRIRLALDEIATLAMLGTECLINGDQLTKALREARGIAKKNDDTIYNHPAEYLTTLHKILSDIMGHDFGDTERTAEALVILLTYTERCHEALYPEAHAA